MLLSSDYITVRQYCVVEIIKGFFFLQKYDKITSLTFLLNDLAVQWNLSYPNPLGPEVVHKSEKSVSLKLCINNSYTTAARDFADIYTQSPRAAGVYVSKIPSSHGTSDMYHLWRTHLIGERTTENSSRLFYTVASED